MPTKKQLEARIAELVSDSGHEAVRTANQIAAFEERIETLQSLVTKLKGHSRPFFLRADVGPLWAKGTAHCPICNACAPAQMRLDPFGRPLIVTARPLDHQPDCVHNIPTTSMEVEHGSLDS